MRVQDKRAAPHPPPPPRQRYRCRLRLLWGRVCVSHGSSLCKARPGDGPLPWDACDRSAPCQGSVATAEPVLAEPTPSTGPPAASSPSFLSPLQSSPISEAHLLGSFIHFASNLSCHTLRPGGQPCPQWLQGPRHRPRSLSPASGGQHRVCFSGPQLTMCACLRRIKRRTESLQVVFSHCRGSADETCCSYS